MATKEYTLADVAAHKEQEDLWIVIRDEVYDITKFVSEHPGGEEVLVEYGGKDSTEAFDDVGHSQDAKDLLKQFHVGTIVESERAANKVKAKAEETKKCLILALSGLAIGVGLVILIKYAKSK